MTPTDHGSTTLINHMITGRKQRISNFSLKHGKDKEIDMDKLSKDGSFPQLTQITDFIWLVMTFVMFLFLMFLIVSPMLKLFLKLIHLLRSEIILNKMNGIEHQNGFPSKKVSHTTLKLVTQRLVIKIIFQ